MTSEDQLDSIDSESPNTTPRGQKKTVFQGKLPGLVSHPSPFYLSSKKEYTQLTSGAVSGRSIASNNHEISEVRRLYERSSTLEKKEGFDFAQDTDQWSATHRQRTRDHEGEDKDDFTFHEKEDDEENVKKEVAITIEEKAKKTKKGKKKTIKEKATDSESPEKADKPKRKRKKSFDSVGVSSKKNSEDLDIASSEGKSTEGDKKIEEKKKIPKKGKSRKSKSRPKEEEHAEEKKSDSDSSQSNKKKNKEMNFRQLMAIKQQSLSISEQHPIAHDANGFIMTESISFVSSPQSLLALTKQESCPSPMGPKAEKLKASSKKEKTKKNDKKEKYEVESTDGDKPKKSKEKKNKDKNKEKKTHHHHHEHRPKQILLSDGLNLVKLMTDRINCKKTKLLIMLYTFTVLWSIVLNGLEFAFFTDTGCKPFTEVGTAYFCFILMILLKFLGISLFNLELTFKQPYKSSIGFLYPLMVQCFCPLLQLPQNVYDFGGCQDTNHVVRIRDSWKYLQAIIGSIVGIALYFSIKQKIDLTILKSRLGRLVNKFVKCIVFLVALGWNVIFIVIFCAQKHVFLPSLFFDFYLYIVLAVSVGVCYMAKSKLGSEELKKAFIKDEKKLTEPLTPALQTSPVKEMIKIEVQQ